MYPLWFVSSCLQFPHFLCSCFISSIHNKLHSTFYRVKVGLFILYNQYSRAVFHSVSPRHPWTDYTQLPKFTSHSPAKHISTTLYSLTEAFLSCGSNSFSFKQNHSPISNSYFTAAPCSGKSLRHLTIDILTNPTE